jgi:hypothetical protein
MGAILDLTEKLKTPTGIVVAIVIIIVGVLFVRWVFAEDKNKQD